MDKLYAGQIIELARTWSPCYCQSWFMLGGNSKGSLCRFLERSELPTDADVISEPEQHLPPYISWFYKGKETKNQSSLIRLCILRYFYLGQWRFLLFSHQFQLAKQQLQNYMYNTMWAIISHFPSFFLESVVITARQGATWLALLWVWKVLNGWFKGGVSERECRYDASETDTTGSQPWWFT